MKCGRFRRWWLIPIGLFFLPTFLWVAIVLAAPTDWARARFAGAIEKATGRSVKVDQLSVCLFGGLRLTNLEIGAPGAIDDPWLRSGELTLDLSPLSVFRGHLRPGQLDVYDTTLRILRRKDGTLELTDLVKPAKQNPGKSDAESDCCALGTCLAGAHRLKIGIHRGLVVIVDQVNETRYELQDVEGEATLEGKSIGNLAVNGSVNGGSFQLTGQFDRTLKEPSFDIQLDGCDIDLSENHHGLRFFMPALAGERSQLDGKLTGRLSLQGRGADMATLSRSLRGDGFLRLEPVSLEGSSFLDTIYKVAELPASHRIESIRSQFTIEDQRITSNASTLQLGSIPVKFTGWADFTGALDYKVHIDSVTNRIPDKALRFLREIDINVEKLSVLQLTGTLDHLTVRLDGEPLNPEGPALRPKSGDERERLRALSRKFLDRIIR